MTGNAFEIRIALHEMLEYLILLFIAGLQRHTVLPISFAVVVFVPPEMVGLNTHQHIHKG